MNADTRRVFEKLALDMSVEGSRKGAEAEAAEDMQEKNLKWAIGSVYLSVSNSINAALKREEGVI